MLLFLSAFLLHHLRHHIKPADQHKILTCCISINVCLYYSKPQWHLTWSLSVIEHRKPLPCTRALVFVHPVLAGWANRIAMRLRNTRITNTSCNNLLCLNMTVVLSDLSRRTFRIDFPLIVFSYCERYINDDLLSHASLWQLCLLAFSVWKITLPPSPLTPTHSLLVVRTCCGWAQQDNQWPQE